MVWGKNTPSFDEKPDGQEEDETTLLREFAEFRAWLDGVSMPPPPLPTGEPLANDQPAEGLPMQQEGGAWYGRRGSRFGRVCVQHVYSAGKICSRHDVGEMVGGFHERGYDISVSCLGEDEAQKIQRVRDMIAEKKRKLAMESERLGFQESCCALCFDLDTHVDTYTSTGRRFVSMCVASR